MVIAKLWVVTEPVESVELVQDQVLSATKTRIAAIQLRNVSHTMAATATVLYLEDDGSGACLHQSRSPVC